MGLIVDKWTMWKTQDALKNQVLKFLLFSGRRSWSPETSKVELKVKRTRILREDREYDNLCGAIRTNLYDHVHIDISL